MQKGFWRSEESLAEQGSAHVCEETTKAQGEHYPRGLEVTSLSTHARPGIILILPVGLENVTIEGPWVAYTGDLPLAGQNSP